MWIFIASIILSQQAYIYVYYKWKANLVFITKPGHESYFFSFVWENLKFLDDPILLCDIKWLENYIWYIIHLQIIKSPQEKGDKKNGNEEVIVGLFFGDYTKFHPCYVTYVCILNSMWHDANVLFTDTPLLGRSYDAWIWLLQVRKGFSHVNSASFIDISINFVKPYELEELALFWKISIKFHPRECHSKGYTIEAIPWTTFI